MSDRKLGSRVLDGRARRREVHEMILRALSALVAVFILLSAFFLTQNRDHTNHFLQPSTTTFSAVPKGGDPDPPDMGEKGEKGDKGDRGPRGPKGEPGDSSCSCGEPKSQPSPVIEPAQKVQPLSPVVPSSGQQGGLGFTFIPPVVGNTTGVGK